MVLHWQLYQQTMQDINVIFNISGLQRQNIRDREPAGLLRTGKRGFRDDPEDPDWDAVRHRPVWEGALRQPPRHPGQPSDHAGGDWD